MNINFKHIQGLICPANTYRRDTVFPDGTPQEGFVGLCQWEYQKFSSVRECAGDRNE